MSHDVYINEFRRHPTQRSLYLSLCHATALVDCASTIYSADNHIMRPSFFGHSFSAPSICNEVGDISSNSMMSVLGSWLRSHEEAQVMVGSLLVVFGIWWLVRTLLSLVINLLCPLLLVLLAVVCVPQLRQPLLGQNYPVVSSVLRNILMKMAENIKSAE